MGVLAHIKDIFIVSSIFSLIGIGIVITLKSGVVSMGRQRCELMFGNLSRMVVALSACLVFFMMAQQMAGIRLVTPW